MEAWTLDGVVPTTLAERGARLWSAGRERFEVDAGTGERVSAVCSLPHDRRRVEIASVPALAAPCLRPPERPASRLPPLADDCMADGRGAAEELRIEGINDRATLARAPGSRHPLRLSLRALGTGARVQWLLDGRRIGETEGARSFSHDVDEAGDHTLTALA